MVKKVHWPLVLSLFLLLQPCLPQPAVADSALVARKGYEEQNNGNPFVIIPYKTNYLLPYSYNSRPNSAPYPSGTAELDNVEVKFQFSFKLPLARDLFHNNGELFFAYTNISFWQAYNKDVSSPFRETNHEPELFVSVDNDFSFLGLTNRANAIGISHQSNGRSGTLSRSWNRVFGLFLFDRGNFVLALKPWWRIPEDEKQSPTDPDGDDNPDIHRYLGYGEVYAFYKYGRQTFGMMLRNNLRSDDNRGALQLDWTFPISDNLKGYVQYFNGYGESLIDYNSSVNRIGIGVLLTDWL